MKKMHSLFLVGALFVVTTQAQVTVTNPTNTNPNLAATYTSLANAITALNTITTISGPVTITLTAGNPQTTPAGGYAIQFMATTTAANNITIEGNGNTITAFTPQSVSNLNDAIFKLIGADYITLQNFVMVENGGNTVNAPAVSNTMTEWGVALLHSSMSNGAQNNTIQNNTISLNKNYQNTFGIYSNSRHSATAPTGTDDANNGTTAPNSGNKIYGNTISNVNMGITFVGANTSANQDVGNDIGGSSVATGNTISNWGGTAALSNYTSNSGTSYCIFSNHQTNENISYNTITSAAVSGTSVTFVGIRKDYTVIGSQPIGTVTSTISYNTITMSSGFTTGTFDAILSQGMTALSTATINITNNTILNCAMTGASSGSSFVAIFNSSVPGVLNITNNTVRGTTSTATSGGFVGIQNTGAVVTTVNLSNNNFGSGGVGPVTFSVSTSNSIIGILNSAAAVGATLTISNNTIDGIVCVNSAFITGISCSLATGINTTISGNSFINNAVTGIGSATSITGISNASAAASLTISNNIIRGNTSTATTVGFTGIQNSGLVVNTINIINNQVGNAAGGAITFNAATTGSINVINNTGAAATCTINLNNNSIDGINVVSSGQIIGIQNTGITAVAVNINNNQLGSVTGTFVSFSAAMPNTLLGVINNAGTSATTVTIQGNDIKGILQPVAGTGQYQLIVSNVAVLSQNVLSNTFTNLTLRTSNSVYFVLRQGNMASGASFTCSNNSIVTGFSKATAGNQVAFLYSTGSSVTGSTMTVTGNNFSNVTLTGNTVVYGFLLLEGVSAASGPTKTITGNTVSNLSGSTTTQVGFWLNRGDATNCSSNTISNISGGGNIYGVIFDTNNGAGTHTCASNTISSFASSGFGSYVIGITGGNSAMTTFNVNNNSITGLSISNYANVQAIGISGGTTVNVNDNLITNLSGSNTTLSGITGIIVIDGTTVNLYNNKINTISATGAISGPGRYVNGIYLYAGATCNVYNNFISDLTAPNTNSISAIAGIEIPSIVAPSTYNLYYNSIYINAGSTGTDFGTYAVLAATSVTATTASLNMINNIIVNTSTANGAGFTVAYGRTDATLTNYASTADYNLLYAGAPSATRLIYYDGTNSDQTLAAYQTRVSTRDANSISLMPTFTSNIDLHLTPANCQLDGRGTPIGITTDIDAASRDVSNPDIGADEFTATASTTLAGLVGSALCETRTVSVTGTTYTSNVCDLIARILPSGADPVAGKVNACVTLDDMSGALPVFNAEPYVTRHFDIEPVTSNTTTTSATVTLYFTQAEFDNFNSKNAAWPDLPTGPADALGIANLRVTQYHGTPLTTPSEAGMYSANSGNGVLINPADVSIVWNGSYWAVTFDVTGFSGFYVHTNLPWPLPITINYFTGVKQGGNHLLNWKVTCNATPSVTMQLERSADGRNFTGINSITATALRCNQPFDYTDANPLQGMNYYRLKITDVDGKISYSSVVALLNAVKGFDIISIAPNPVVGDNFKLNVTSATAAKMDITILDMQGRLMSRQTVNVIAGFNILPVNAANLSAGTYSISGIVAGERSKTVRFVKQ